MLSLEELKTLIDKDKYKVKKKKIKRTYRPETLEKMEETRKRQMRQRAEARKQARLRKKLKRLALEKKIKEEKREVKKKAKLKRAQYLESLVPLGYKQGYTSPAPDKPRRNGRDRDLCRTIYFKAMNGMTTRQMANEYDRPYNWVLRHKYEYAYYLNLVENSKKGDSDDPESFWS
jgi:hypothetical protein